MRLVCEYFVGILTCKGAREQLGRHARSNGGLARSFEDVLGTVLSSNIDVVVGEEYVQFLDAPLAYRLSLTSDDLTPEQKAFFRILTVKHGDQFFRSKHWSPTGQPVYTRFFGNHTLSSLFPRRALAFALICDILTTPRQREHFHTVRVALLIALRRLSLRLRHSLCYFLQYTYSWVARALYAHPDDGFSRILYHTQTWDRSHRARLGSPAPEPAGPQDTDAPCLTEVAQSDHCESTNGGAGDTRRANSGTSRSGRDSPPAGKTIRQTEAPSTAHCQIHERDSETRVGGGGTTKTTTTGE